MLINFLVYPILACIAIFCTCGRTGGPDSSDRGLILSALPSSVRLDPVSGKIIENRPDIYEMRTLDGLLQQNWIFSHDTVRLHAARGEYVSFQIVIGSPDGAAHKDIYAGMFPFACGGNPLAAGPPELFLEWSVELRGKSSGYEKSSYGPGWYPDALIPLDCLDTDPEFNGRIWYPLNLPDFRNRIPGQRYQIIWVDQFVPVDSQSAPPGVYRSEIAVRSGESMRSLAVELTVHDCAIPNGNRLWGNLQHEGFLSRMDEKAELELYQLFKKHRVTLADNGYRPDLTVTPSGKVEIDWARFDKRLKKYFTGEAFTAAYGYSGPGYGEPWEEFLLPFDCWREHEGRQHAGWPDAGTAAEEREPGKQALYVDAIRQVREHLLSMTDPEKTHLIVFQAGLDESYFPEAWERMVYYGGLFKKHFPESKYRVDGGYSLEAMQAIHGAIDYWCCHTVGYDMETVKKYRELGIRDWVYGPLLYERKENSGVGSSTFIDLEPSNDRLISWACWKYQALTWCSWGIGSQWRKAWYSPETWHFAVRTKDKPLVERSFNGNALLVYAPGIVQSVDVPCPSIRLKNMRDGVEEWEMLRTLADIDGNTERADSIAGRLVNNPFGEQSIGRFDVWNHNPQDWDEARLALIETIEQAGKGQ